MKQHGIDTIEFNGTHYPLFQAQGFAAQYAFPFAEKICKGIGYDIGCGRKEWCLRGAIPIDPAMNEHHAMNLPMSVNFIFSSHCLEHLPDWVGVLDYWETRLQTNGVLFLYLPHPEQEYWLPWNQRNHTKTNTPHVNLLYPYMIKQYLEARKWKNIFVTGYDLNHSFYAIAEKP
jgi:hypothetical protein